MSGKRSSTPRRSKSNVYVRRIRHSVKTVGYASDVLLMHDIRRKHASVVGARVPSHDNPSIS